MRQINLIFCVIFVYISLKNIYIFLKFWGLAGLPDRLSAGHVRQSRTQNIFFPLKKPQSAGHGQKICGHKLISDGLVYKKIIYIIYCIHDVYAIIFSVGPKTRNRNRKRNKILKPGTLSAGKKNWLKPGIKPYLEKKIEVLKSGIKKVKYTKIRNGKGEKIDNNLKPGTERNL